MNAAFNEEDDVPLIKLVRSSSKNAELFKPQMHITDNKLELHKLKQYSSDDEEADPEVCFVIISIHKLTKLGLICSPVKLH